MSDHFINDPSTEDPDLDWREVMSTILSDTSEVQIHVRRLMLGGEMEATICQKLEGVKLYCESILSILP